MNADTPDDDLITRVAEGEAEAFRVLVARHQGRILAIATRMTGSRAIAEELVQESFTRLWRQAPRWRSSGTARSGGAAAWLARTAVNLAIDHRRRPLHVPLERAPDPVDAAPRADDVLIARERATRLETAVKALPERQRAAISLTYDAELSNAQGAAALGTSVGAFELLLVRARRSLRAALADGSTP